MSLIPAVGLSGTLVATAPFDQVVTTQVKYTVAAAQTLSSMMSQGVEVYDSYYKPYGLTQERCDADISAGVMLITLQSYSGEQLQVPHTYLSAMPDPTGVAYRMRAITLELQMPLPDSLELTGFKSDLEQWVMSRLGTSSTAHDVNYGPTTLMTVSQDASLRTARAANRTSPQSYLQQTVLLRRLLDEQTQKHESLQQWIATKLPLLSPGHI